MSSTEEKARFARQPEIQDFIEEIAGILEKDRARGFLCIDSVDRTALSAAKSCGYGDCINDMISVIKKWRKGASK